MDQQFTAIYQNVNGEDLIIINKISTTKDSLVLSADDIQNQITFHQNELARFQKYQDMILNKSGAQTTDSNATSPQVIQ